MSRTSGFLFWFMVIAGHATLAPCLILPAWLEYQEAVAQVTSHESRIAACEAQLKAQGKQIEHLQNDAAYIERIARQELKLPIPGVTSVLVDAGPGEAEASAAAAAGIGESQPPVAGPPELFPQLSNVLSAGMRLYPAWMRLFMMEQTRPVMLALSVGMLLSAVLLLGKRTQRAAAGQVERPVVVVSD